MFSPIVTSMLRNFWCKWRHDFGKHYLQINAYLLTWLPHVPWPQTIVMQYFITCLLFFTVSFPRVEMFCLRLSLELLLATNKNKNISTVLPPPQSFFKQLIQPFVYLLSTSHIVLLSFTTQNVSLTSSNPKRVSYFFLSS